MDIYFFSVDCESLTGCDTCPGGQELTSNAACPNENICEEFMCRNDADCNTPNGSCNLATNQCMCDLKYIGLDCSLERLGKKIFIRQIKSRQL